MRAVEKMQNIEQTHSYVPAKMQCSEHMSVIFAASNWSVWYDCLFQAHTVTTGSGLFD